MNKKLLVILILLALTVGSAAALLAAQVIESRLAPVPAQKGVGGGAAAPALVSSHPREEYNPIVERNLFGATVRAADETSSVAASQGQETAPVLPILKIQLLGTVSAKTPYAMAVIKEMEKGRVGTYHVGDRLGAAQILQIRRAKVLILYGKEYKSVGIGQTVTLGETPPPAPPTGSKPSREVGGDEKTISRSELLARLGGRKEDILGQAKFVPFLVNNQWKGIRMSGISSKSVLKEMGVQEDDVIVRANGYAIDGYQASVDVWERLKGANDITLEILRNGEQKIFRYSMTK